MGVSGSELQALRYVEEKGGKVAAQPVARQLKLNVDYARIILTSLAKRDYLDLLKDGLYYLTMNGQDELDRKRDRR